jgi:hypothetical protein
MHELYPSKEALDAAGTGTADAIGGTLKPTDDSFVTYVQLVVVELGEGYRLKAVGTLTLTQFKHALRTDPRLSSAPVIRRSMLAPNGLITRFGHVERGEALAKIFHR